MNGSTFSAKSDGGARRNLEKFLISLFHGHSKEKRTMNEKGKANIGGAVIEKNITQ